MNTETPTSSQQSSKALAQPSLVEVKNLFKSYPIQSGFGAGLWKGRSQSVKVQAIRGITLSLFSSETLAVVGESGCGKSTLAKLIMKLEAPDSGEIQLSGRDIQQIERVHLPDFVQMVFQDPHSSLNPRKKIIASIIEPLLVRKVLVEEAESRAKEIAAQVGLRPELLDRYPHMLSGGQKQRVGIARALITRPKVILCDEPVSALDVSVQAQVINLLLDLKQKFGLSYLFISHDLNVVRFIADRVAVLYLGQVVELSTKSELFKNPLHPYTQLLLESKSSTGLQTDAEGRPNSEKELAVEVAELPSPINPPKGCGFHTRCPYAKERCRTEAPQLREISRPTHMAACHFAAEILAGQLS